MGRKMTLNVATAPRAAHRRETALALFGGPPEIAPGLVRPWPAANMQHLEALARVIQSGKYHRVNHPLVCELEEHLGLWSGGLRVRAVGSGTAAIHVALDYYKDRGSRVVTSALNWPGAVGPILMAGLEPHFIDVDAKLAGIDETSAISSIEPGVAGILITHLFGNNIRVPTLRASARTKNVPLVDDICQSIGAAKKIAGGGHLDTDVFALSGNGAKHLGAGEIGFILTQDGGLIDHVDRVSLTSSSRNNERVFSPNSQGHNYRPNVFSAALANHRLQQLDQQLERRRYNAAYLWKEIVKLPGLVPIFDPTDQDQSLLNFPLRIQPEHLGLPSGPATRDFIVKLLKAEGVPVWVWLTRPVFEYLPSVRHKWSKNDFPNTAQLLDSMFYVSEIAPPNDELVMQRYVSAFHKVWSALPHLTSRIRQVAEI